MIPYAILPALKIGPFHINAYGIMFALGVFIAILLAKKEAKKRNINPEIIEDLALYLILGTIIGARVFYVLFYWPGNVPFEFIDIFKIWEGGLAFFGGFIGAIMAGYIYAKKKKLPFWKFADIFTYPLIVGHILGRIGDYLTGAHPGMETTLPWGIYLEGAIRHPVVLYEIIGLVLILGIILLLKRKKLKEGILFSSYIVLYSVQRLFLDIFRIEATDPRFIGLTPAQIVSIIIGIFAVTFILKEKLKEENESK